MRSLQIAMILLVMLAATGCTDGSEPDLGYSAVLASTGPGDVQDAVRITNEVRESSVIFYFLERRLARYGKADYTLVEALNEQDELHRFVLIVSTGGAFEMVTNIGLPPNVTGPAATLPGEILVYEVVSDPDLDRLFALASQSVPSGVGGLADVDDGDSYFLTQQVGRNVNKSVLYGVSFLPLDNEPDKPTDNPDVARYAATEAVYALWQDALAASPTPSEVISTTP